jgi:hypothetical protein
MTMMTKKNRANFSLKRRMNARKEDAAPTTPRKEYVSGERGEVLVLYNRDLLLCRLRISP